MSKIANFFTGLVAAVEVVIATAEMVVLPLSESIRKHVAKDIGIETATAWDARYIVMNAGLYNAFLAAGLIWTLVDRNGTRRAQIFFLGCVLVAGLFGMTLNFKTLLMQSLPAALALFFVLRNRSHAA